ncbi:MAG: hypothetical protein JWO69_190 [Thermoleophilia bacterium]|jgi:hypothetical protein|nr:hypothetical protein [Thermoleophilia bacterium]
MTITTSSTAAPGWIAPTIIGTGATAGAAIGTTATITSLRKVDAAARSGASVLKASNRIGMMTMALGSAAPLLVNAVAQVHKRGSDVSPLIVAMGAGSAGVVALGLSTIGARTGYSMLVAPSGAWNPGDIAGNLEARHARAGAKPGAIVGAVIKLLR